MLMEVVVTDPSETKPAFGADCSKIVTCRPTASSDRGHFSCPPIVVDSPGESGAFVVSRCMWHGRLTPRCLARAGRAEAHVGAIASSAAAIATRAETIFRERM